MRCMGQLGSLPGVLQRAEQLITASMLCITFYVMKDASKLGARWRNDGAVPAALVCQVMVRYSTVSLGRQLFLFAILGMPSLVGLSF
jgi:hypothetical protein